ncbi:MAG: site-specific integrase [Planctomycetota bacterium]|nr:site-specific integrase [Planctomycetota bacterium]MDA1250922.1 site-specific integrase [Planctomycetota bacterium]
MASIHRDPSGNFHLHFRFGGNRFKRSLHTKHERKAVAVASHVEENIRLVKEGRLELPDDADVPTFLLSDGKLVETPKVAKNISLGSLFDRFRELTPDGAFEATSLRTFRGHMKHVTRILGERTLLRSVRTTDLQRYVTTRSGEQGRRGKVSPVTIRKELATFGSLWNWARTQELVEGDFPCRGVVFGKHDEKPAFQTWSQIERQISRDGLNEYEAEPLWQTLYLDAGEIKKLLEHVREKATYGFLHPMCVLAAHTGARRSELCRTRVADVDLDDSTIIIRERKRAGDFTFRSPPTTRNWPSVASRFQGTNTEAPLTEHTQAVSGLVLSSSAPAALWLHLLRFFLASSFPPFVVELFAVRCCYSPSRVFAETPRPVTVSVHSVARVKLPTRANVERGQSPRAPSPDFHRIRHDDRLNPARCGKSKAFLRRPH